jgi:hypothetical protein
MGTLHPLSSVRNLQNFWRRPCCSARQKHAQHLAASTCCLYLKNSFSEMYVCARCFVQCYRAHYVVTVLILWSGQRRFLHICVRAVYVKAIYRRINVCTYPQEHWKPLHPLCSWSCYGPGSDQRATVYVNVTTEHEAGSVKQLVLI